MSRNWLVVLLLALGPVAIAQDDVVFATSDDASAFDHALMNQQGKSVGVKASDAMSGINIHHEVMAAKIASQAPARRRDQQGANIAASASSGSRIAGSGPAIQGGQSVVMPAGTAVGGAPVTGAPAAAMPAHH